MPTRILQPSDFLIAGDIICWTDGDTTIVDDFLIGAPVRDVQARCFPIDHIERKMENDEDDLISRIEQHYASKQI